MFPWDTLAEAAAAAGAHPDGIVDLSVGTPVDPVAPVIQAALAGAASAPGYPFTAGTGELRAAAVAALGRRYAVTGLAEHAVLPVIGTKELIALMIAVVKRCDGCIASHAKAAAAKGVTKEQVAEAIGVAMLMDGGPATVYGPRAYEAFCEFVEPDANQESTTGETVHA